MKTLSDDRRTARHGEVGLWMVAVTAGGLLLPGLGLLIGLLLAFTRLRHEAAVARWAPAAAGAAVLALQVGGLAGGSSTHDVSPIRPVSG